MIVIAAGRRIDADNAKQERFPLRNAGRVAVEIKSRLENLKPEIVVSSAACGADLIFLREAVSLGIRTRIVLAFAAARFRVTSVTDRPGNPTWDWGAIFDELTRKAQERDDLIILPTQDDDNAAYAATNGRIIDEAKTLSGQFDKQGSEEEGRARIGALIIWEGSSRGEDDLTAELAARARAAGIPVEQIHTL